MIALTETTASQPSDDTSMPAVDFDDADNSETVELWALRNQLTRQINASRYPSQLINRLVLADLRCRASAKGLSRLISGAPKVLRVIRAELRKAFALDPDNLLFTERRPPAVAEKVDSLTERALQVLVLPSLAINLNQFTAVSLKDDPARRLPFTPLEALRKVVALNLFGRLAHAQNAYWQTLAAGSWLTREERWTELYKQQFVDQAFVARQLDELSDAGLAMVQAVVDAPTAQARQHAGAQWACIHVSPLIWPGTGPRLMPIPGALHIYREDSPADRLHVIYLAGGKRNFHEYPSFAQLQCGLLALINSALFDDLWQCLPLRRRHEVCKPDSGPAVGRGSALSGDVLAFSAQAVLEGQWENELACAASINHAHVFSAGRLPAVLNPARFLAHIERARKHWVGKARLGSHRRDLQAWDHHRRRKEIIFNSTAPGLALSTALQQIKRYETGLMTLLDPLEQGRDTQAFRDFVALEDQRQAQAHALRALLQGAHLQLFSAAFWKARPTGQDKRLASVIAAWSALLRCAILVQHRLALIRAPHRDLLIEVLDKPIASARPGSDICALSVQVGSEADAWRPLHSVFVVTRAAAISDPTKRAPVVLCAFGMGGGVATFASLAALSDSIKASLGSRDESVLCRYVERQQRKAVRELAVKQTLAVRYSPVDGNPVHFALTTRVKCYVRLLRDIDSGTPVFSEVRQPELSRELLVIELDEHLNAPVNEALFQARANVDLLHKAQGAKQKWPTWLHEATVAQHRRYTYLQARWLGDVFAFEEHLKQRLPDLYTFARRILIARLREDRLDPQPDIDTLFIEMPDHVSGRFCDFQSACTVGDRKVILTPSTERSCFSLLQLALHNLDPQLMPTEWRFKYARYLVPAWKPQLNPRYLISMISSLDIGGQYAALIERTFYSPVAAVQKLSGARVPQLSRRVLLAGFESDLYGAAQQGLTVQAQSLLKTAMAATTPQDLQKNGHQLQLCVVHLVGHTLLHDRYIAGMLVVHDLLSERCVVYWPTAPDALSISEHASLEQARQHLNRIGALPNNTTALARHVAPGWAFEAINPHPGETREALGGFFQLLPGYVMYEGVARGSDFVRSFNIKHLYPTAIDEEVENQLREQIASASQHWLALVPTSHCNAGALLYRARVLDLLRQTQASSNCRRTLEKYREERLQEEKDSRTRALLSMFVPFFGLGNQLYELLLTSRNYHRHGDPRDAVGVAFGAVLVTIDLLLAFVPGPKPKAGAVARPTMPRLATGLNRLHRSSLAQFGRASYPAKSPAKVTQLTPLERFRVQGVPQDAIALTGAGEKSVYMKGGEHFVADATHHYPVYRRSGEGFFRLKNQQAPGEDELILTIREPRDWLLGADAPVAGPSSGVLNPWRAPAQLPSWRPPSVRIATEYRILQSPAPDNYWFSWRTRVPANQVQSSAGGVLHVHLEPPGIPYNAIYVGARYDTPTQTGVGYYRLIHQGEHAALDNIAFISPDEPLVSLARVDLERWTTIAPREQPIPVSRTAMGEWQLHTPLFNGPPEAEVATAFPGLTSTSRTFVVARLLELADSSRSVTASHLLNVRATLDNWLTPNPQRMGQTDDLLRMLRPSGRKGSSVFIGYDGKAPGFTRVDFTPPVELDLTLRTGGAKVTAQRHAAQRAAVRTVLEQQGFTLRHWDVRRGGIANNYETVASHPHSNQLYYIYYQWVERASIVVGAKLTDEWIKVALKANMNPALTALVRGALDEQRLVPLVAGVQWSRSAISPATVYFVKLTPA